MDPRDGASIYDALASDELGDDAREEMIQYLIDFFIDKQHYKLDTVGFVTGQLGFITHGLKDVEGSDAGAVRQILRDMNIVYNQQAMEDDSKKVEILCDLEHGAEATLTPRLAAYGYSLERIEVLPNWAKKVLLRSGKNKYAGAARDKYGRSSGYLKREDTSRNDNRGSSGRSQDKGCFNCGESGHWSKECPHPRGHRDTVGRGDGRGRPGERDASGGRYSEGGFMKGHVAPQGRGDRRGHSDDGRGFRDQQGSRRGPDRDSRDRDQRQQRPKRDDRESRFSETF